MEIVWLAFFTGLTTGGISCLAVQGGLLASSVSQKSETQSSKSIVAMFLGSKLAAYTTLGAVLGGMGGALTITPALQGWMQIIAGLYMLAVAGNLLNIHPVLRYTVIQPPKFVFKFLRNKSRSEAGVAPAVLGAATVFMPCGVTQGMIVLAVASGSAMSGAAIMFAFTLGTSPLFAVLGMGASKLLEKKAFVYAASAVIVAVALVSINTGQVLRGSVHTAQNYWSAIARSENQRLSVVAGVSAEGFQEVTMEVDQYGYRPSANTLHVGVPVRLTLKTNEAYGCSLAFTMPSVNVSAILLPTDEKTVEFTPNKRGRLVYSCTMGMYSGEFEVI